LKWRKGHLRLAIVVEPPYIFDLKEFIKRERLVVHQKGTRFKGKFIVFEGIDGSGKTSQLERVALWLKQHNITVMTNREPTSSPAGLRLRESASSGRVTPEEEAELFLQDRRWNVENNILPALRADKTILQDRYYYSTIAYQGARGLDADEIRRKNEAFAPRPDLVLLFDLDPETALERIKKNRGEIPNLFEKLDYLKRVRQVFLSLGDSDIVRIDAAGTVEDVWEQVQTAVGPLFPQISPP
jgi:dTMP kinase